jgi:hypothetical protein
MVPDSSIAQCLHTMLLSHHITLSGGCFARGRPMLSSTNPLSFAMMWQYCYHADARHFFMVRQVMIALSPSTTLTCSPPSDSIVLLTLAFCTNPVPEKTFRSGCLSFAAFADSCPSDPECVDPERGGKNAHHGQEPLEPQSRRRVTTCKR